MNLSPPSRLGADQGLSLDAAWQLIRDAMRELKAGSITLTVREGLLVQVCRDGVRGADLRSA